MTLASKLNGPINVQFSLLEEKYAPFLKKGEDLNSKFQGQLLNELISIPCNNFSGIQLEKSTIPLIVEKKWNLNYKRFSKKRLFDFCFFDKRKVIIKISKKRSTEHLWDFLCNCNLKNY